MFNYCHNEHINRKRQYGAWTILTETFYKKKLIILHGPSSLNNFRTNSNIIILVAKMFQNFQVHTNKVKVLDNLISFRVNKNHKFN